MGSQTITIIERPSRQTSKVFLFLALLGAIAWLAWHEGVRWWDGYSAYSGVIVAKGEDYSILDIFFGDSSGPDLYVILRDDRGNRSKRYVGSWDSSIRDWSQLEIGSFVVKNRGLGEFPRVPGKALRAAAPPLPDTEFSSRDALFVGLLVFIRLTVAWFLRRFR